MMKRSRKQASACYTARLQAAMLGPGVEVAVQDNGTRWSYIQYGDDSRYIVETITTGWDARFIIPAEVVVA